MFYFPLSIFDHGCRSVLVQILRAMLRTSLLDRFVLGYQSSLSLCSLIESYGDSREKLTIKPWKLSDWQILFFTKDKGPSEITDMRTGVCTCGKASLKKKKRNKIDLKADCIDLRFDDLLLQGDNWDVVCATCLMRPNGKGCIWCRTQFPVSAGSLWWKKGRWQEEENARVYIWE